jgi:hypothetical protein
MSASSPRLPDHVAPVDRVEKAGGPSAVRSWPLLVLALPASVAVWSGWVGIGQMTGFGLVRPLPGIWSSLHIDTAVTLPVGVEAYAAMALHAWLTGRSVSARTRRFAMWSAIGSLVLGVAGQVAYHLLAEAHVTRAPWEVTTLVASLPVVVLGLGTALAHMLRADAVAAQHGPRISAPGPVLPVLGPATADRTSDTGPGDSEVADHRPDEARAVAELLAAAGRRASRRSLRAVGVRGSNAELGDLARRLRTDGHVHGSSAAI